MRYSITVNEEELREHVTIQSHLRLAHALLHVLSRTSDIDKLQDAHRVLLNYGIAIQEDKTART